MPDFQITYQAVLGRDLSSQLIAWYGNGYRGFSHIDCVLLDGSLVGARSDVIAGVPAGVQRRPADYERWKRRARLSMPVSRETYERWGFFLKNQIGKQYDKGAIWGFITGRADHSEGRWICSALATQSLRQITHLTLSVPDSQITPNSFSLIAQAKGFYYQEYPC